METTIGERIRELRKKNDLTQEKLADFLCVSCQAVSKWECGVASPDLSLIAPLTRLFHVSADELLGLEENPEKERRKELEELYKKTWQTGDLKERYETARSAVSEFPGEMKYLCWLAGCEEALAHECKEDSEYFAWLEKSVRNYRTVIENTKERDVLCPAVSGIVISLSLLRRKEEGLKYAALYPEPEELSRLEVMDWVLDGEEKQKNQQKLLELRFSDFIRTMLNAGGFGNPNCLMHRRAACDMIKLMVPDGNYLYYHDFLYLSYVDQAAMLTQSKDLDGAMAALNTAYFHAAQYDDMVAAGRTVHRYTAPMFCLVEIDCSTFCRSSSETNREGLLSWLNSKYFDALRGREDFQAFVRKCSQ